MGNQGFYYLAGPHKGTPEEERYRYETSLKITTEFLHHNISVFSPIVYGKHITEACAFPSLEEQRMKLMGYLLEFLQVSKGMILVTMDGWQKSWGANQELLFCQANHIPVYILDPFEVPENYARTLLSPLDPQQLSQLLQAA